MIFDHSKNKSFIRANQLVAVPVGDKYQIRLGSGEVEVFDSSVAALILGMSKLQSVSATLRETIEALPRLKKLQLLVELAHLSATALSEIPLSRSGFADMVERTFELLNQRGVVQTRDELLASLPQPRVQERRRLSTLGIVTAGRPQALQRSLESYLSVARRFARTLRVVVADDSRDLTLVEQNRGICKQISKEFRVDIEHVTRKDREQLISSHANGDAGIRSALNFALFGYAGDVETYGANRNTLHLCTRGEVLLSVDDDTICNPFISKDFSGGVDIDTTSFKCEATRFWPTRDDAKGSLTPYQGDPFVFVEQALGATLLELSHQALSEPEAAFEGFQPLAIEELLLQQSRVALAMYGLVGDSGSESGLGFIFDDIADPSPAYYEIASKSREATKCVDKTTVRRQGPCMTMFFGCNNNESLPLFFPNFRNEDFLFKETLLCADMGARLAYLPCVFEHAPLTSRTKSIRMAIDSSLSVDEFFKAAFSVATRHFHPKRNESRLSSFGDCLIQLAETEPATMQRLCVEFALDAKAAGLLKRKARIKEMGRYLPKAVQKQVLSQHSEAERQLAALSRELLEKTRYDLWPHLQLGSCCELLKNYGVALTVLCR